MGHFAKIDENNIVTEVIVAEQSDIDSGRHGDPTMWIQTSYNTRGGVHYGPDGLPDGGVALRYNYAYLGGNYDSTADAFYAPQPTINGELSDCHYLDTNTYKWELKPEYPKPEVPVGGKDYWVFVGIRKQWEYFEPDYTPPTE